MTEEICNTSCYQIRSTNNHYRQNEETSYVNCFHLQTTNFIITDTNLSASKSYYYYFRALLKMAPIKRYNHPKRFAPPLLQQISSTIRIYYYQSYLHHRLIAKESNLRASTLTYSLMLIYRLLLAAYQSIRAHV